MNYSVIFHPQSLNLCSDQIRIPGCSDIFNSTPHAYSNLSSNNAEKRFEEAIHVSEKRLSTLPSPKLSYASVGLKLGYKWCEIKKIKISQCSKSVRCIRKEVWSEKLPKNLQN